MFLALAEALEARDAFSGAHSLRVASLASTVGERLGWDEARLMRLRIGALLHDIGKLALARAADGYPDGVHGEARTPDERVRAERHALGVDHAVMMATRQQEIPS